MSHEWQGPLRPEEKPNIEEIPPAENPAVEKIEKTSSINRIVNVSSEKEREILKIIEADFKEQEFDSMERIKTEEENKLIEFINIKLKDFISRYGGIPLDFNPENIHLLDIDKIGKTEMDKMENENKGWCDMKNQAIFILPNVQKKVEMLVKTIVHEMLHFCSFQSVRDTESGGEMHRSGLVIYSKKSDEEYFVDVNEAVIEELSLRFCSEFIGEIKENMMSYNQQRERLHIDMARIFQANKNRFKNKEEVFNLFAKSVMTGRLKELAKIIESTFGKGSFKRGAEKTAKIK